MPPGILLAGPPGRSSSANLINVSISRARGKLVVIADRPFYAASAAGGPLCAVLDAIKREGTLVFWESLAANG